MDLAAPVQWRLSQIMDQHHVKASDIAKEVGVSQTAVGLWRKADILPGIGGERISQIAIAINKFSKIGGGVKPLDLLG